jgi:hypothetical protein
MQSLFAGVGRRTLALVVGMLIVVSAGNALAQSPAKVIYSGEIIDGNRIAIGSWGSGYCEDIPKHGYSGSRSLKFTTRSLYEGGRIDFKPSLDLTEAFKQPNTYLQLVAKFREDASGIPDPLLEGFHTPSDTDTTSTAKSTPVSRVRVALKIEGAPMLELQADVASFRIGDDGWMPLSFPLSALKGKRELQQHKLSRLVIAGNGTQPFHIGEIRIVTDSKPLRVDAGMDQFVAANDDILFRPHCDGGAAALKYSWDFDSKDGIQEDAIGEIVYHKYRKPGKYTVTLTVSDVFGIKETVTKTMNVTVYD